MTPKPTTLPQEKGVYTVLAKVSPSTWIKVGGLGKFKFSGLYAYTGSAIGKGSSSLNRRIARHTSRIKKPWWHIDYLLKHPNVVAEGIVSSLTVIKAKECEVSKNVISLSGSPPIIGFGSSDCSCSSHLACLYDDTGDALLKVSFAHRQAGLAPRVATCRASRQNVLICEEQL